MASDSGPMKALMMFQSAVEQTSNRSDGCICHRIVYPVSQKKLYRGVSFGHFYPEKSGDVVKKTETGPGWTFSQALVFLLTAPLPGAIASRHMERNHRHGLLS